MARNRDSEQTTKKARKKPDTGTETVPVKAAAAEKGTAAAGHRNTCLLYTSPSPRDS